MSAPARVAAGTALTFVAVVAVSLTLRSPIAAVSPVLGEMRADLGLGAGAAGLLTTLPVLCFAAFSGLSLALYRRTGAEVALVASMVVLALGTLLRSAPGSSPWPAMAGTVLIGLGIAVGNVVVPVVAKRDFGRRSSLVVGVYTASLTGGAALAAAGTAPVADQVGWRPALLTWDVLVVVAIGLWVAVGVQRRRRESAPVEAAPPVRNPLWRDRTAIALAVLFGTQSLLYYAMTAWLPSLLGSPPEAGGQLLDRSHAGVALSLMQVVGIAGSLLVPTLLHRGRDQRTLGLVIGALWLVSLLGLLVAPAAWPAWVVLMGFGQGAGISYALAVMVLRAGDDAMAARLSGFVQGAGYLLSAGGPVLVGAAFDRTGSWHVPLLALAGVAVVLTAMSQVAGRDRTIAH